MQCEIIMQNFDDYITEQPPSLFLPATEHIESDPDDLVESNLRDEFKSSVLEEKLEAVEISKAISDIEISKNFDNIEEELDENLAEQKAFNESKVKYAIDRKPSQESYELEL
jgi:hypothetical protein